MANEINIRHSATGVVLYAVVLNEAGQYWNGSVFGTLVVANWGDYDIPLTETPASSYHYFEDFPAAAAAGKYRILFFQRATGSPLISDPIVGISELFAWTGSAELDKFAASVIELLTKTGVTAGGTWTIGTILKVLAAIINGDIKDKAGETNILQFLDPDNGSTVIAELTYSETTPYSTWSFP